jgi:hypothetical protein
VEVRAVLCVLHEEGAGQQVEIVKCRALPIVLLLRHCGKKHWVRHKEGCNTIRKFRSSHPPDSGSKDFPFHYLSIWTFLTLDSKGRRETGRVHKQEGREGAPELIDGNNSRYKIALNFSLLLIKMVGIAL